MDANRLAALLEGRLAGADLEAALAELAALDEEDLGVFVDAAAVLREQEQERDDAMSEDEGAEKVTLPLPPAFVARRARADQLRPHVKRWVEEKGLAEVAAAAELKADSVRRFVYHGVTPQPGGMDAFEEMMLRPEWAQISGEISPAEGGGDAE